MVLHRFGFAIVDGHIERVGTCSPFFEKLLFGTCHIIFHYL